MPNLDMAAILAGNKSTVGAYIQAVFRHSHTRLFLLDAVVSQRAGGSRRQEVQENVHLWKQTCFVVSVFMCRMMQREMMAGTHRRHGGDGSGEAPDQRVVHGEPTEVRVPVAFRVQAHCQTWTNTDTHQFTVCTSSRFSPLRGHISL